MINELKEKIKQLEAEVKRLNEVNKEIDFRLELRNGELKNIREQFSLGVEESERLNAEIDELTEKNEKLQADVDKLKAEKQEIRDKFLFWAEKNLDPSYERYQIELHARDLFGKVQSQDKKWQLTQNWLDEQR
jgi:chromosome segregation ATPase